MEPAKSPINAKAQKTIQLLPGQQQLTFGPPKVGHKKRSRTTTSSTTHLSSQASAVPNSASNPILVDWDSDDDVLTPKKVRPGVVSSGSKLLQQPWEVDVRFSEAETKVIDLRQDWASG